MQNHNPINTMFWPWHRRDHKASLFEHGDLYGFMAISNDKPVLGVPRYPIFSDTEHGEHDHNSQAPSWLSPVPADTPFFRCSKWWQTTRFEGDFEGDFFVFFPPSFAHLGWTSTSQLGAKGEAWGFKQPWTLPMAWWGSCGKACDLVTEP